MVKSSIYKIVLFCVSLCMLISLSFPGLAKAGAKAQVRVEQAKVKFSGGDYEDALALLAEALSEEPDNAEAAHYAGLCELALGNAGGAVNYLRQAAELDPDDAGAWEDLSWAQLQADMSGPALASAQTALELDPESARAAFYKGKALMGERRFGEALPVLEGLFSSEDFAQASRYYAGVCLLHQGRTREARVHFERARDLGPETELGVRSAKYVSTLGGERPRPAVRREKKPWSGRVRLLYQYDSNIALVPEEDLLPEDITEMDDSRGVVDLAGRYRYASGRFEGSARYVGYSSWHSREGEADIMYHMGGVGAFYDAPAGGADVRAGLRGSYSGSWVDNDPYTNVWKASPEVSVSWTKSLRTRVVGEYGGEVFDEPGEGENDRDNNKASASLYQHFFLLDERVNAWLGYSFARVSAEGENYNRVENAFHAGVISALPMKAVASLSGRYEVRDFVDSAFEREERRTFLSGSVQAPVYKTLHVYGGVSYGTVDANLASLEYDRSIYSAGMLARF